MCTAEINGVLLLSMQTHPYFCCVCLYRSACSPSFSTTTECCRSSWPDLARARPEAPDRAPCSTQSQQQHSIIIQSDGEIMAADCSGRAAVREPMLLWGVQSLHAHVLRFWQCSMCAATPLQTAQWPFTLQGINYSLLTQAH